jgi:electron transport complex protein RnfG
MENKSNIKNTVIPPLVLALICAVCCGLLAFANNVTKDKIAAAEANAILSSLSELPGDGDFTEINDYEAVNNEKATVDSVYLDSNGQYAVLVTADGYNKGGIQAVIGVLDDGTVSGISFVSVSETPGLGTKVQSNPELLVDNIIGKSIDDNIDDIDSITGATYSSKGMKAAVVAALDTVNKIKEG